MEARRTLRIVNRQGLHARPCHSIVSTAMEYDSELRVRSGGREVDGKSIIEMMTLSAAEGAELDFHAWGVDAEDLLAAIEEIVRSGFGEELGEPGLAKPGS